MDPLVIAEAGGETVLQRMTSPEEDQPLLGKASCCNVHTVPSYIVGASAVALVILGVALSPTVASPSLLSISMFVLGGAIGIPNLLNLYWGYKYPIVGNAKQVLESLNDERKKEKAAFAEELQKQQALQAEVEKRHAAALANQETLLKDAQTANATQKDLLARQETQNQQLQTQCSDLQKEIANIRAIDTHLAEKEQRLGDLNIQLSVTQGKLAATQEMLEKVSTKLNTGVEHLGHELQTLHNVDAELERRLTPKPEPFHARPSSDRGASPTGT